MPNALSRTSSSAGQGWRWQAVGSVSGSYTNSAHPPLTGWAVLIHFLSNNHLSVLMETVWYCVIWIYECLGDTEITTPFKIHTNDITIVVATTYIRRYSTNMYISKLCLDWTEGQFIHLENCFDRIQALRLHHSGCKEKAPQTQI